MTESKRKDDRLPDRKVCKRSDSRRGLPYLRPMMMSRLEDNATGLVQKASLYHQSRTQDVCTAQGLVEKSITHAAEEMDGDLAVCKENEELREYLRCGTQPPFCL